MSEDKVRIKLQKELLESERKEIRARRRRKLLIALLCVLFLIIGLFSGLLLSKKTNGIANAIIETNKYDKIAQYMKSLWVYGNEYDNLDQTLSDKSYYGMTTFEEDPYTSYMSKEELESFQNYIGRNYVGIGCQYKFENEIATITKVFKNSPAEKGGMLAGDIIIKVNGESVKGFNSDMIKATITGEEGSQVKVTVLRGTEEVELIFTRAAIDYTVNVEAQNDYVYLTLSSFALNSGSEMNSYLADYRDYKKIIIDLRDNTGGYETALQEIAGLFLGKDKVVLKEIDKDGNETVYKTKVINYYDNFEKIIILTNNNTASAAEAFTACMKELHPNCIQVGTTTYGKGVVQATLPLNDGSFLKITKSYWSSPNGVVFHKTGIEPDIEVKLADILYESVVAIKDDEIYEVDSVSDVNRIVQMCLEFIGYDVKRIDGYFDSNLKDVLNKFKNDFGLEENGVIDKETYNLVISRTSYEYQNNPEKDYQLSKAKELLND